MFSELFADISPEPVWTSSVISFMPEKEELLKLSPAHAEILLRLGKGNSEGKIGWFT